MFRVCSDMRPPRFAGVLVETWMHTKIAVLKGIVAHLRWRISAPEERPAEGLTPGRAKELLAAYQQELEWLQTGPEETLQE